MDIQKTAPSAGETTPKKEKLKYAGVGRKTMMIGLLFLAFCIVLAAGLTIYNMTLEKQINTTTEEITNKQNSINELLTDEEVLTYKTFIDNKSSFNTLAKYSRISDMVEELNSISTSHDLSFSDIAISEGTITVNGVATTSPNIELSYEKISDFVSDYKQEQQSKHMNMKKKADLNAKNSESSAGTQQKSELIYDIKDILEYSGHEEIEFPLEITIL